METLGLQPLLPSAAECGANELRERARLDGYLYLPGLFDSRAVAALRARVLETCRRLGWLAPGSDPTYALADPAATPVATGEPGSVALHAEILPSRELDRIRRDSGLERVLSAIFGGEFETHQGDVCRVVFPNAELLTTPVHQDGAYVGVDRECWTMWTPLGDCPLVLGPLAVVPGSHRGPLLEHANGEARVPHGHPDSGWAANGLDAGDALLFHALTLHRALPNRSGDTLRLSVDCRYRAG